MMEGTNTSKDFFKTINGHYMEYYDEGHIYLVDGIIVPSITSLLHKDYSCVNPSILREAARKGTELHEAIENYCKFDTESDLVEVESFKQLQAEYGFKVLENEIPVILFDGEPVAAGRVDLVIEMNGEIGGADIKRVSRLDKKALSDQLNLYRIAYAQSYGVEWQFLKGIHLKDKVKKLVDIPIKAFATLDFMEEENI